MGGCFRFFVGLFCAMLALEVLAELFSWTDVPFDALLLLAAAVYGGILRRARLPARLQGRAHRQEKLLAEGGCQHGQGHCQGDGAAAPR